MRNEHSGSAPGALVLVLVAAGCGGGTTPVMDSGATVDAGQDASALVDANDQVDAAIALDAGPPPAECATWCATSPVATLDTTCRDYLTANCADALAACDADTVRPDAAACNTCSESLTIGGTGVGGICHDGGAQSLTLSVALYQCGCHAG